MAWALLAGSKQTQRSNLTSDLKSSVTPITYLSMPILLIWCGPFWQPLRPPQPPNSPRVQIWPQIWNQWPHLPTYPCAYWLYDMGSFGSLRGHHSLKTASEVKHDLNLNSGTQITYFSMSTLLTCVAIAAGNKPFRHFVGYHNNRHQRNYVKKPGKTSPTTRTIPSEVCAAKHGWI